MGMRVRIVGNPAETQKQLVSNVVERVFVYGGNVLAIWLYGDFAATLEKTQQRPKVLWTPFVLTWWIGL